MIKKHPEILKGYCDSLKKLKTHKSDIKVIKKKRL